MLAAVLLSACGRGAPSTSPAPAPVTPPTVRQDSAPRTPAREVPARPPNVQPSPSHDPYDSLPGRLPVIPAVANAPLAVKVVYPARDQMLATRDSNFILGSVGSGDATLTINGAPVEVKPNGAFLAWLPIPEGTSPAYTLVARRGTDSVSERHPVRTFRTPVPQRPPGPPPKPPLTSGWISLGTRTAGTVDTDRVISVRPTPSGTYKWFAIPGTIVERTGAEGGFTRVRLDQSLEAWVANADVNELADSSSASAPRRVIPNVVVTPDSAWTDIVFPVREPPPYFVEEDGDKLVLTLYSTRATTDIISYRPGDSLVRVVTYEPVTTDRVRYVVHLRRPPYGYLVFHDGRALVLRVRRPPAINAERPLAGIVITVDAGHPPEGATGPTGLYEGDATLPVAMALKDELERRGARVIMTRTTLSPFDLMTRPAIARRNNSHALVSIHFNAAPDGNNPLALNGTGTYFFQPQSEPLARAVQTGMVRAMGLRDLGVFYDNLALVRPTWMPAILCEGAYIIVPEHEAAMRDPVGQRTYARGVAAGIEAYFRSLGVTQ